MNDHRSSFDEIAESQRGDAPSPGQGKDGAPGRGRRRAEAPRRGPLRRLLPAILVLVVLGALGVGGVTGYQWLSGSIRIGQVEAKDYEGPGTGEVTIEVKEGDTGTDIAKTLVEHDVILSTGPFVAIFSATPEASSITPGTYRLKKQMTSSDALQMLLDPASLAGRRITIPEGLRLTAIYERVSEATGIPVADFEALTDDPAAIGLPENPAGSIEGYLWPGRYDIPEDATAQDVLTMMAARMTSELDARGVPEDQRHRVLTIASIAEKEARSPEDYGKVVRTIDNRLAGTGEAGGVPMKLQLDSTVAYVSGRQAVSTTPAERAVDSPYNTYRVEGLPVGPIANPGGATIDAVLDPPEGDWLYWVTVNTDTGETKFAATKAEHDANVAQWRAWAETKNG
ncbi:endolytic transglycosylase MltG [Brachybacterium hainanense]|uniref:Endolytic murein transglycosylase n=1 Tax=Brachybacterium hainanense TaxID=1541174 RepID=A0ABV6RBV7_9MICO